MAADTFGARSTLSVDGRGHEIFRLGALDGVERLPFSLKILLENLLRQEATGAATAEHVQAIAGWDAKATPQDEIGFAPARVILQDFTGVPAVVDLAAMRDAMEELGSDPTKVDPLVPVDLVIDHSIIAEVFGAPDAFERNADIEFERNRERYALLRWAQQAFERFRVVPPNTGIVHQVNLEYLSQVVIARDGQAFPDTLVGTDSHTPMVNGLGVLAWGVGGIEAEAAMLGQPISMLVPEVVGFQLEGELPEGSTATDLVLTVTEKLRQHGVVGRFVEFYGEGVGRVPLATRATIGNMSPEYGSTVAMFPIDDETLRYLRFTGREELVPLVEAYAKEQGLWHDPSVTPEYSTTLTLDLSTVEPSLAGPARPQDRVPLSQAKSAWRRALADQLPAGGPTEPAHQPGVPRQELPAGVEPATADEGSADSFPASDPPAPSVDNAPPAAAAAGAAADEGGRDRPRNPIQVTLEDGTSFELDHGHVTIAAITSCTNTSNPHVMLAAGLLAKKATERGLVRKPWVKTTLAPGSKVVMDYYERADLLPYLEKLGFNLVGYGCTTCIGNSGPLIPEVSQAVADGDLAVCSVLSGNRNFEGRINPDVRMNYLASPPLVVAYAIAGTVDIDLLNDPLGEDEDGQPVYLRDIWPSTDEIERTVERSVDAQMFEERYADVFTGDHRWAALTDEASGERFAWDSSSTYVQQPPFFLGMDAEPAPVEDIRDARVLAWLGDSTTTDHISPAGAIKADSPAGRYLQEEGVEPRDFNSFGARRGNHEVMMRGTFGNIRLRNRLVGREGGWTRTLPDGEELPIFDAAERYREQGTPLVVLAGKEYGSGSSRDWAAKGTLLLGVRAVIAESYERIHRSNLIGMGVLPLQLAAGTTLEDLGLSGEETFTIEGLADLQPGATVTVRTDGGTEFEALARIDTPTELDYYRHGGILPYVLRELAG
jgi:aconitate hydratase